MKKRHLVGLLAALCMLPAVSSAADLKPWDIQNADWISNGTTGCKLPDRCTYEEATAVQMAAHAGSTFIEYVPCEWTSATDGVCRIRAYWPPAGPNPIILGGISWRVRN